jgi:hypothetical protein
MKLCIDFKIGVANATPQTLIRIFVNVTNPPEFL